MIDLLERLVVVPGPSGFEDAVATAIRAEVEDLGDVTIDSIGNLILRLPAAEGAPSLMLMAHMDQVGLLVKWVDADGFLYCDANGLVDARALLGVRVTVWADGGPLPGVVGVGSPHVLGDHERDRVPPINDLWIDVGAGSPDGAAALGIDAGTPVTLVGPPERMGEHLFVSGCIDNRAGCAVLVEVARAARDLEVELVFVWSTQEEIGSRGARVAAHWIQPTIAVVIDTMPAGDPSTPARVATASVGRGPVIRAQDTRGMQGTIYHLPIRKRLVEIARANDIPYQTDVFPTWTDAAEVHLAGRGVPTGGIFIPRRCSHSASEVVDVRDIERTIDILRELVTVDAAAVAELGRRPTFPPA